MEKQSYKNHVTYYPAHHFIFYPILTAAIICCVMNANKHPDRTMEWLAMGLLFLMIAWLSFMLRQHYSLMNQDRIARLELRLRYYQLTQKRLEDFEDRLSKRQLLALRFASDEELPALVEQAVNEQVKPDNIKRSIRNWLPDYWRV